MALPVSVQKGESLSCAPPRQQEDIVYSVVVTLTATKIMCLAPILADVSPILSLGYVSILNIASYNSTIMLGMRVQN